MKKKNKRNKRTFFSSVKEFLYRSFDRIVVLSLVFAQSFENFSRFNPHILRIIQLTCLYTAALIDLTQSVLMSVVTLDGIPDLMKPFSMVIKAMIENPILQFWASPEKTLLLSYIIFEFAIFRSVFKLTKLIKYHVLAVFSLLSLQGLIFLSWDLFFNREVSIIAESLGFFTFDKNLAIFIYLNTFFLFLGIYTFYYIEGLKGKFPLLPFCNWFNDSVAFWLKIKTKTMKFGKRPEDKN